MNLARTTLEHGERFSKLTVLYKSPTRSSYTCGCECGRKVHASAKELMSGKVKACVRCSHD